MTNRVHFVGDATCVYRKEVGKEDVVLDGEKGATLILLELQSHCGDNPLKFQVVCPPKRDCGPKNPCGAAVSLWGQATQISSSLSPKRDCGPNNPSRAAVPLWGQSSQISSSMSPKRDRGPKMVYIYQVRTVAHRMTDHDLPAGPPGPEIR